MCHGRDIPATSDDRAPVNDASPVSKVPAVTLLFWVLKILATTLGETAGDTLSMTLNLGYLAATGVFAAVFVVAVAGQILAPRFHPWIYWATIIATTTVGTTLADFATPSAPCQSRRFGRRGPSCSTG